MKSDKTSASTVFKTHANATRSTR